MPLGGAPPPYPELARGRWAALKGCSDARRTAVGGSGASKGHPDQPRERASRPTGGPREVHPCL